MRVFISWHGEVSKTVAEALREWLPNVIQDLQPFVSSEDIHKGDVWFGKVSGELESSSIGILCLTPDALTAAWILFEAGALSKQVGQKAVIPLLIGIQPADLRPPLSNFQATQATREDILRMMQTINAAMGEHGLAEAKLMKAFERWWPDLQADLDKAHEALRQGGKKAPERSERDILLEILELVRGVAQRRGGVTLATPQDAAWWTADKVEQVGIINKAIAEAVRDSVTAASFAQLGMKLGDLSRGVQTQPPGDAATIKETPTKRTDRGEPEPQ